MLPWDHDNPYQSADTRPSRPEPPPNRELLAPTTTTRPLPTLTIPKETRPTSRASRQTTPQTGEQDRKELSASGRENRTTHR